MAVRTVYKGTTSYKDPVTGSIYVDRGQDSSAAVQNTAAQNNTPTASATKGVMGSADIYPGSLHGDTPETTKTVTYNGSDAPGPTWTGQQSTFYSKSRPERTTFQRSEYTPAYEEYERPDFVASALTNSYLQKMQDTEGAKPGDYTPSALATGYQQQMKEYEGKEPDEFSSRYEGAIQSILDGILNTKPFDLKSDTNYNLLYDQMREAYMNAGNKAMRDAMGAMQAQTGGYGSTAAAAAGSQAYDNYLQGMNDQNSVLAQLAYQMYGDQIADRYNQLGAVEGLDNTDYQRWLQDYNNWANNRQYYANQNWNADQSDYGKYRDTVNDWLSDRQYYANQYQNMYGNDWNEYQFGAQMDYDKWKYLDDKDWQQYQYDTNMDWNQYALDTQMDWDEYQYDNNLAYQMSRDALSDYDDAYNQAYKLAAAGQSIPARYSSFLEPETLAQLQGLAAQMQAAQAGGSSSGGSSRRSGSSKQSVEEVITNRNGDGWVYVDGIGRITDAELEKYVDKGLIQESTKTVKGDSGNVIQHTYTKKGNVNTRQGNAYKVNYGVK